MDLFLRSRSVSNAADATHYSMVGGKYNIPMSDTNDFHTLYCENYSSCHLVEKVTYPGRLFVDIDKVSEKEVKQTIETLVVSNVPSAIVCIREKDENGYYGVHIITSVIMINKEDAVNKCQNMLKTIAVDKSVYNTGLRMIGSNKKIMGRQYFPYFKITEGQMRTLDRKITKSLLDQCSIRPTDDELLNVCKIHTVPLAKQVVSSLRMPISLGYIHPNYANTRILSKRIIDGYTVLNTDSKFCQNINKEHKSVSVYFVVSRDRIYQKCFCRCSHHTCGTYKSKPKVLPPLMRKLIAL